MSDALNDIKDVGSDLLRRLAGRQVVAIERYGDALKQYADGKVDTAEFGKRILNLAYHEAARTAEDAFKLSVKYYAWLFSVAGIKLGEVAEGKAQAEKGSSGKPARAAS